MKVVARIAVTLTGGTDGDVDPATGSAAPGGNFVVGLDIATGRELWRFHTIARPGEPGGGRRARR